jgi:hypothetical protein
MSTHNRGLGNAVAASLNLAVSRAGSQTENGAESQNENGAGSQNAAAGQARFENENGTSVLLGDSTMNNPGDSKACIIKRQLLI